MSVSALPSAVVNDARDAIKAFLRTDGTAEDPLLARLAASALLTAESFLGDLLIARDCEEAIAADGAWRPLSGAPVSAIAAVTADAPLPVDAYAVEIGADGRGWARVAPSAGRRATVSYVAGRAADWPSVPAPIAQGVVLLAAHLFDNRDAGVMPPAAVSALWRPFRLLRLGDAR